MAYPSLSSSAEPRTVATFRVSTDTISRNENFDEVQSVVNGVNEGCCLPHIHFLELRRKCLFLSKCLLWHYIGAHCTI